MYSSSWIVERLYYDGQEYNLLNKGRVRYDILFVTEKSYLRNKEDIQIKICDEKNQCFSFTFYKYICKMYTLADIHWNCRKSRFI